MLWIGITIGAGVYGLAKQSKIAYWIAGISGVMSCVYVVGSVIAASSAY